MFKITRRGAIGLGIGAAVAGLAPHVIAGPKRDPLLASYAVNVASWWGDVPLLDRFALASAAGFEAVEMWGVHDEAYSPKDIRKRLDEHGLKLVQILAWFGPGLTDPAQEKPFLEAMKQAIEDAEYLGADMMTVVGHQDDPSLAMEEKMARLQGAYEAALPMLEDGKKTMLLEPFNEFNHPGHFIYGSPEALQICRAVDSPHLKLNWDLFHMQRHEGELVQRFRDGIDQVGYVQMADTPDRHQAGTGELNYDYIFQECRNAGYEGYFGLECWPKDGDAEQAVADFRAVAPA